MGLWDTVRGAVDPQFKADIEFARRVNYNDRNNWPEIAWFLRKYYKIESMLSEMKASIAEYGADSWLGRRVRSTHRGFERTKNIPSDIVSLYEDWTQSVDNFQRTQARWHEIEIERYTNRAEAASARQSEQYARNESARLRDESSRLRSAMQQQESSHRQQLASNERERQQEIASLKEEINELRVELARHEGRLDEQKRSRKMAYLANMEQQLRELENR